MKLFNLSLLIEAAELGLEHLSKTRRKLAQQAILAAYLELKIREESRKRKRPARTATRALIRAELLQYYASVRLNSDEQWLVQSKPGASWTFFALNDNDAQEELIMMERKAKVTQECACVTPHSNAAGVVEACLAGKREAELEMNGGWL